MAGLGGPCATILFVTTGSLPPLALAYHGVADVPLRDDPYGLFVAPRDLRRHMAALRAWGYQLVTFGELAARAGEGKAAGAAALTFDDGFADNLEALVPLLTDIRAPATVFVVSGWLGRPHPLVQWARILTPAEVVALARTGIVEIGGHSVTHPDLSALSYSEARAELASSKTALEELIGAPVEVAAYPYGRASAETIDACRDAGFRAACRVTGKGSWDDPHNLPRQDMENRSSLIGLRLKRDDRYEPLMRFAPVRAARRVGRRFRAFVR